MCSQYTTCCKNSTHYRPCMRVQSGYYCMYFYVLHSLRFESGSSCDAVTTPRLFRHTISVQGLFDVLEVLDVARYMMMLSGFTKASILLWACLFPTIIRSASENRPCPCEDANHCSVITTGPRKEVDFRMPCECFLSTHITRFLA